MNHSTPRSLSADPADPPRHPGASRPETVDARLVLGRVRSAEESLAQLAGLAITTEDSTLLRMVPTALEKLTRTVAGLRARTLAAIEADRPRALYGAAIGSNYQGQDLRLSKYFRQDA